MTAMRPLRHPAALGGALFAFLAAAACGPGEAAQDAGSEEAAAVEPASSSGGPAVTLTIGDDAWSFDRVFCAFGEDTGQDDISFSLSARQNGMQLDAQISERFGHTIDISSLDGSGDAWNAGEGGLGGGDFLQVDGRQVTAETTFTNSATGETAVGTLGADCS